MAFGVVAVVVVAGLWWFGVGSGGEVNLPVAADLPSTVEAIDAAKDVQGIVSGRAEQVVADLPGAGLPLAEKMVSEFGVVVPMTIGGVTVWASIATTTADRIKGLSGTSALPDEVVKLFTFESAGGQSIWMKDMLYPIDILWLDEKGVVVHVAKNVSPETYPNTFSSPQPAMYVIETGAGFADKHGVTVGTSVALPKVIADI